MAVRLILAACMDPGSTPGISTKTYYDMGMEWIWQQDKGMGRSRVTGETVDLAKVNVEDILSYITDLAIDAGYVEETSMLMAA